jgi:ElaB/YqjD/DUF883 family membrane-anchored ribosome-binding protein
MGKKATNYLNSNHHSAMVLSPKKFRKKFDRLTPFILQEWQQLESDALAATEGNLDSVVNYITSQTKHSRTLIQQHLTELYQLVKSEKNKKVETIQTDLVELQDQVIPSVEKTLDALEKRAETVLAQLEEKLLLPEVKERVREKPGMSLLTALGIGFLIGLIVGGSNRGSR